MKLVEVINCTECKKRLSNKVITYDGRAWHTECFTKEVEQEALTSTDNISGDKQ